MTMHNPFQPVEKIKTEVFSEEQTAADYLKILGY
jgi:hypothetical protein